MKKYSQRDIAKALGVNVSTVSRALRGLDGVSPDLRKRIAHFAMERGYHPQVLSGIDGDGKAHIIGIVIPDVSFSHYAHIVKHIESEARSMGYMCIVADTDDCYENEVVCMETLTAMRVDGIILCLSQRTTDHSHLQRVKDRGIPLVLFDRAADVDVASVVIDDVISARQVTHYLIDGGARRIAFLGGSNQMKQTSDRKHGYLEALRERHIPIRRELVKCHDASFNSGLSDTLDLMSLPEPPDAIIASYGMLAISAFHSIMSLHLRIPEDVAIVGYLSDWVSDMTTPRMTFVRQNLKEIGSTAFRLLVDQINGDRKVKHLVVKSRLEIRDSTRKID